jgi:hypothetical protein
MPGDIIFVGFYLFFPREFGRIKGAGGVSRSYIIFSSHPKPPRVPTQEREMNETEM